MKKFIYTNHNTKETETIEAKCILEADTEFEKRTGIKACKVFIGCSIYKIFSKENKNGSS
jgi:hypothetical protein